MFSVFSVSALLLPSNRVLRYHREKPRQHVRGRSLGIGSRPQTVLRLALIAVGVVLLWLAIPTSAPGTANDFVEYWAASRLMLDGSNPYDLTQMLAIERSLGFAGKDALPMLNPPWALPLVLPLALLPYPASQAVWLTLNFLLLLASVELCRRVYWRWELRPLAWMLGFTFVPALTCMAIGQITILVLLGLVGFLYFESQQQYWLAGCPWWLPRSSRTSYGCCGQRFCCGRCGGDAEASSWPLALPWHS
jgi:Glycosyltransferase family 87